MLTTYPLVTCILPTQNRPQFIPHVIKFFQVQNYPNKELFILYSVDADLPVDFEYPENVYTICTGDISLGAKRNFLLASVKGEYVAQWDDDDIYGANRLSAQMEPLIAGRADITGLNNVLFYDVATGKCWERSPMAFSRMFDGGVQCGTIAFKKNIWGRLAEYPDVTHREEGLFLQTALKNGAILERINGRDHYIYMRHSTNTWKFKIEYNYRNTGWKLQTLPGWARMHDSFFNILH